MKYRREGKEARVGQREINKSEQKKKKKITLSRS